MMILNKLLRHRRHPPASGAGWLAVIASALAFAFLLLDSVSGSEVPPVAARGTAVQGGPPPSLALMFTGEVMGWTEPCG
jgi:hypothetical protein